MATSKKNSAAPIGSVNDTKQVDISKAPEQTSQNLIVNKMVFISPDRSPKDVGNWRDSHRAAESIYYPNRTRLYDLYLDIELDGHLSGLKTKRIDSVLNKKIRYVDKKKSNEIEDVCELINTNRFRYMCHELLNSIFWGMTGLEFIPGADFNFALIPRKHIKPEKKVITVNQNDYGGTPYDGVKNLWVVGQDRDLGLFLKCAFYVLLKYGNFSDWANYIEIFGQPIIVTRFDTFDEKTKIQLAQAMEHIGNSMRMSIPKQAEIEVLDTKSTNGNGDLQNHFKDACNEELSVMVLGNTETTKSSKSSGYAQSSTHGQQQFEIAKSDMQLLLGWLNSDDFKDILGMYGFDTTGEFIVEEMMMPQDQLVRAQTVQILKIMGLPLDDEQLYEEFGLTKPADYDQQKKEAEALPPVPVNPKEIPNDKKEQQQQQGGQPQKGGAAKPDDTKPNLSFFDTLRATLADFFDPAHKG